MLAPSNKHKTTLSLVKISSYSSFPILDLVKLYLISKDESVWQECYKRFSKYIKLYLRKAWKLRVSSTNVDSAHTKEILRDLSQNTYVKLLEFDCQALRNFQGQSETSFLAYLAKIAANVVSEYSRKQSATKRRGTELSIEALLDNETCELFGTRALSFDFLSVDGEKSCFTQLAGKQASEFIENSLNSPNSKRDFLIFRLSVAEGLTPKQIIEAANLDLKPSSIESIVRRVKDKIRMLVNSSLISNKTPNKTLKKAA